MAWLLNKKKSRETLNPSRRRCHRAPVDITRIQNQSVCVKSAAVIHRLMGKRALLCSGLTQPACTGTVRWGGAHFVPGLGACERTEEQVEDGRSEQHFMSRDMPRVLRLQNARSRTRTATFFFVCFSPPGAPKGVTKFHPRLGNVTVN